MTTKNKHGLSRRVSAEIKREIRQRCGFGCVICGFGFYEYEHFAPDFADATYHDPDGMTLLCSHCNQKRARGRLSAHTVALANANPKCRERGFANEMFDFHSEPIEVTFAGSTFYDCQHVIVINSRPILSVQPPPQKGAPVRLSGVFCDSVGRETLFIHENEWSVGLGTWDVECVGPRIIVRSAPREIALVIKMNAPHGIEIEQIDMFYQGIYIKGEKGVLRISYDGKRWHSWTGCSMRCCYAGISISNRPAAANEDIYGV